MTFKSPHDLLPVTVERAGFELRLSQHLQFPEIFVARMSYEEGGSMLMLDLDRAQGEALRDWLLDWLAG